MLAFDFETHLIQPGLLAPPIVCGAFAEGKEISLLNRASSIQQLTSALKRGGTIVGANVAYDFGCALAVSPELLPAIWSAYNEGRVLDILIAATLDAIAEGRLTDNGLFTRTGRKIQSGRYSLSAAVSEYLGRDDAKKNDAWRKSYAHLEQLPIEKWPELARQYPMDDARNTLQVAEVLLAESSNLGNQSTQAHAHFCAHLGAIWGLRTDPAEVGRLHQRVQAELDKLRQFARGKGLIKSDGVKDTKLIKELVFKAYDGLPPKTDGGGISTSRETLEDSGDPLLEQFSEISKWEKLSVYAESLHSLGSAPMNVSCNPLLATGRASYAGLIQLMPRSGGVRECFVARPGTVWSSVDYAAIEMVTLAQVQLWTVGRSRLAEELNKGVDPHSLFAAAMTGASYDEFLKRKSLPKEAGLRQAAKAANFGFPGMMGAAKFVIAKKREGSSVCTWLDAEAKCGENKVREWKLKELDLALCYRCLEAAERLRIAYLTQWPEMKPYWAWVTRNMGVDKRLTQFVSNRVRGGLQGPAGANTLFQGLAADGAKSALVALTREMYLDRRSPLFGSRLMVFAHDETIVEIPEEHAHEAAHRQAEIMVMEMRKFTPDVRVTAEPALMRRWYKSAAAKFDESKKLVPWEPPA